jgi:hypothetical protein
VPGVLIAPERATQPVTLITEAHFETAAQNQLILTFISEPLARVDRLDTRRNGKPPKPTHFIKPFSTDPVPGHQLYSTLVVIRLDGHPLRKQNKQDGRREP